MIEDPNASKSGRTRLRILHAAAKVFRQNGYAASSLRDGVAAATTALEQGKGMQSLENLRAATKAAVSAAQISAG